MLLDTSERYIFTGAGFALCGAGTVVNGKDMLRIVLFFATLALLTTGCVSAGKYKRTVAGYDSRVDSLRQQLSDREGKINTLNYELARSQGANAALLTTQDKLQERIDALQAEIDQLSQRAADTRQNFSGQLDAVSAEKGRLEKKLADIRTMLQQRESEALAIATAVRDSLAKFLNSQYVTIDARGAQAVIVLNEEVLFRSGATSRLEAKGRQALQEIAGILLKYPVQTLQVVGHTDNRPVPRQSLNNWQYGALRAVTVVEYLTQELDLGPNRVIAAGKGEYAPLMSNETTEGRARNRRIELIIQPRESDLIRDINRIIGGS